MALNISDKQHVARVLSTFNEGNTLSLITNTEVSGANTFATFKARVQAIIDGATVTSSYKQFGNTFLIPALNQANALGILTDTNLNGKTTVAGVQALYTAENTDLPLAYKGNNLA